MSLALTSRRAALLPGRWVSNELWRRARAVPSLDLRFAENKSLVDSVSGQNLITFTRASTGTYVDSDGVIRSAATNLLLRSEEFDNASWGKNASSVSVNTTAAPNGTTTADSFLETATTDYHNINAAPTMLASTAYVFSIYAKPNGRDWLVMNIFTGAVSPRTWFNVSTGTIGTVGSGAVASISPAGDGWYRCSIAVTTAASGGPNVAIWTATADNNFFHAGDISKGLYIWGAQLEVGSTATTYLPTGATINSAPRFDHNPLTGECLGLLVEEQRQNLLLRSEEFDNASWSTVTGSVSGNAAVAPSGAQTADKLIAATSPGVSGQLFQSLSIASGATVTASVFAKDGGFDRLELVFLSNSNATPYGRATFNPINGTITTAASTANGGTNASASVTPFGNGWYRLSLTVTYPAVTAAGLRILSFNSDNAVGDGVKGVFLWGAQLEAGAFPTSYIPTTGTAATRTADVASISGTNFSSWYRQDEGTMFADAAEYPFASSLVRIFYGLGSSTNPSTDYVRQWIWNGNTTLMLSSVYTSSSGPVAAEFNVSLAAGLKRTAFAIRANDFARSFNGQAAATDAAGNMSVGIDRLGIGSDNGSGFLSGHIRRLTYWGQRLPNNVLQSITL